MSEAMTQGIDHGGLTKVSEIRIFICYILKYASKKVPSEVLMNEIYEAGLVNYMELVGAFNNLEKDNNIVAIEGDPPYHYYAVTNQGSDIAETLATSVPLTVREKGLEIAEGIITYERYKKENPAFMEKTDKGYNVSLTILEGETAFLKTELLVPDAESAIKAIDKFRKDPTILLKSVTKALTDNKI